MESAGKLAHRLQRAMDEQHLDIKTLAEKIDTTYEHARKITKGTTYPSRHILRNISHALKIGLPELEELATEDRVRHKFGGTVDRIVGQNPEYEMYFGNFWADLEAADKEMLRDMGKTLAKNRRAVRTAAKATSKTA